MIDVVMKKNLKADKKESGKKLHIIIVTIQISMDV